MGADPPRDFDDHVAFFWWASEDRVECSDPRAELLGLELQEGTVAVDDLSPQSPQGDREGFADALRRSQLEPSVSARDFDSGLHGHRPLRAVWESIAARTGEVTVVAGSVFDQPDQPN